MRTSNTARILLAAWFILHATAVRALDIPMDRRLAAQHLDSKTCFSELSRNGRLVGFELQDLLISEGRRIVALRPAGAFDVGDRKVRTYRGDGLVVTIIPTSTRRLGDDTIYQIHEKAKLAVTKRGKQTRFDISVHFQCSP